MKTKEIFFIVLALGSLAWLVNEMGGIVNVSNSVIEPKVLVDSYYNDDVRISPSRTTYEGQRTIQFENGNGEAIGLPMMREDALQVAYDYVSSGRSLYNDRERFDDLSFALNPVNNKQVIFSTLEGYKSVVESLGKSRSNVELLNRFYVYDTETRKLDNFFEDGDRDSYLTILGTYGNDVLLFSNAPESSPSPCYSHWFSKNVYKINMAKLGTPVATKVPSFQVNEAFEMMNKACNGELTPEEFGLQI